jgi:type II secretory pathway pseudopilin PulG
MGMTSRRHQAGLTLIELMVAIIVVLGLVALAADQMQRDSRRSLNDNTAEWLRIVAQGAKAYQTANSAALLSAATSSVPATITPTQLAPFLPTGFLPTNAHGQTFSVRWVEPTTGKLDGMVLTTGGDVISPLDAVYIAGAAKGGGGYVDPTNVGRARGPNGNWSRPLDVFAGGGGAGRLAYALFYDDASALSASSDDLSRVVVSGQPEKNRMATAIDMAWNNITNVDRIIASTGTISTVLADYVGAGDGGQFANITIGTGGWGATYPYETIGLPGTNNLRFNIGGVQQAVLWNSGMFQARTRIHSDGNITAATEISAPTIRGTEIYADGWFRTNGGGGWYSQAYGGGWHMTDTTWIRAYNGKNVYTSGQMRGGQVVSDGRMTAQEFIQMNGVASVGAGCSPNGVQGRDSAGAIVSCVNGVWKSNSGISETMIVSTASGSTVSPGVTCAQGQTNVRAVCPAGWKAISGGHQLIWAYNSGSTKAPAVQYLDVGGNAWFVHSGDDGSCIAAVVSCAR